MDDIRHETSWWYECLAKLKKIDYRHIGKKHAGCSACFKYTQILLFIHSVHSLLLYACLYPEAVISSSYPHCFYYIVYPSLACLLTLYFQPCDNGLEPLYPEPKCTLALCISLVKYASHSQDDARKMRLLLLLHCLSSSASTVYPLFFVIGKCSSPISLFLLPDMSFFFFKSRL